MRGQWRDRARKKKKTITTTTTYVSIDDEKPISFFRIVKGLLFNII